MRGRRSALLVVALAAVAFACTSAPTPTQTAPPTPTASPTPTESPESIPEPTVLSFPSAGEQDLTRGLYDSSPPFAVEFTFLIPDEGWSSAHIHDEFFDVMRLDGPEPNIPTRWVAWGYPETINGPDGTQPASELTP